MHLECIHYYYAAMVVYIQQQPINGFITRKQTCSLKGIEITEKSKETRIQQVRMLNTQRSLFVLK